MSFLSVFLNRTLHIPEQHLDDVKIAAIVGAATAAAASGGNVTSDIINAAVAGVGAVDSTVTPSVPTTPPQTVPVAEPATFAQWLEADALKFSATPIEELSNKIALKTGISAATVDSVLTGGETDILNFVLSKFPSLPTTTAPPVAAT